MAIILTSKSKRRAKKIDGDQEKIIIPSIKRYTITANAESKWRRQGLEDLKFSVGTGQWDETVKANRELEGKPCLTINRAPSFLRQYTGEERQHRPAMLVSPVGSGADLEVAKIHQGVLRHIEVASIAEVTYDNSYDMMMRIGSCPWRVKTDYVHERSFDQEPRIESIENPFSVFLSPVRRPDGTDPLWAHVIRDYSKEEYKAEFGEDRPMAKLNFPMVAGAQEPGWVTKAGARVAEYWWIELNKKELWLLDDGSTMLAEELDDFSEEDKAAFDEGMIVDRRDTIIRAVNCVKHDAMTVLQKDTWLGKYIPFPEVSGVRLNIQGEIYRSGMIRDYRDAQRIYDFMVTRQVEQVDLVSKDPLWVPEENAQFGEDYRQMNRKNFSHLFYKAYTKDGKQLPPPARAGREAPIQAMAEVIKQADYDMKSVIGIYGPSLGEESGSAQESGFAIFSRQEQADTAAIAWHDQLNRAICQQGVILLDVWPKLIKSSRVQRILNPDDSVKHVVVYAGAENQQGAQQMLNAEQGLKKAYDVSVGIYDIVLSAGPMFKTARKETFKALTAVIAEAPEQMLPVVGDIWAKNADFADSDVLYERLKKLVPANMQDSDADDVQSKYTQLQAAFSVLTQQHNIMVQELNRAADTIRTKRLDIESKERIALANNLTQLVLQRLKSHDAAANSLMEAEIASISQRLGVLHQNMGVQEDAGAAPETPELPNAVEPKVQPITPAAPTPRPQPIGGQ